MTFVFAEPIGHAFSMELVLCIWGVGAVVGVGRVAVFVGIEVFP